MIEHRYAEGAARWLRSTRANVGPRTRIEPEQAIASLAGAIRRSGRRQWVTTLIAGVAVALALAASIMMFGRLTQPQAVSGPTTMTSPPGAWRPTTSASFELGGSRAPAPEEGDTLASAMRIRGTANPGRVRRSPHVASTPASTLRDENDLLGQAVRADRSGDLLSALSALDQLIARYPASPLRETAETERARITTGRLP